MTINNDVIDQKKANKIDNDIRILIEQGLPYNYSSRNFAWTITTFKKEFGISGKAQPPYHINKKMVANYYQDTIRGVNNFIVGQLKLSQKILINWTKTKLVWHKNQITLDSTFIEKMAIVPGDKNNSGYLDVYIHNDTLNKDYLFSSISFFLSFYIYR